MRKKAVSAKAREGTIPAREFEALVREAANGLPREFKRRLENITIVIQKEPKSSGTQDELLGLYEGVPFGERTHDHGNVLPDKITIFRGPVLRSCRGRREIRKAVRDTVLHEFAHYFGISDEHMKETGTY